MFQIVTTDKTFVALEARWGLSPGDVGCRFWPEQKDMGCRGPQILPGIPKGELMVTVRNPETGLKFWVCYSCAYNCLTMTPPKTLVAE